MRTLYVSDLDGTLLNTRDAISDYSLGTLNSLMEQGMLFTYATARSLSSACVVTRGLSADMPVVVYNGAFIMNAATGAILSSSSFTPEERQTVIRLLRSHEIYPLVYSFLEGSSLEKNAEKVSWIPLKENEGMKRYLSLRTGDKRLRPSPERICCMRVRFSILPVLEKRPNYSPSMMC